MHTDKEKGDPVHGDPCPGGKFTESKEDQIDNTKDEDQ
jgi:hypothetical protein